MAKWKVRKHDSVWLAVDPNGRTGYFSGAWVPVMTYALMAAERTRFDDYQETIDEMRRIIRDIFRVDE